MLEHRTCNPNAPLKQSLSFAAEARAGLQAANRVLVFFHGENCPDGLGAASVVLHWFKSVWGAPVALLSVSSGHVIASFPGGKEVVFIGCTYNQKPVMPSFQESHVIVVDFDLWRVQMWQETLFVEACSVLWLDHHFSAISATKEKMKVGCSLEKVYFFLDMDYSGAGIAWEVFFETCLPSAMPNHIAFIQDRDAFKNSLEGAALFLRGFDADVPLTLEAFSACLDSWDSTPDEYARWMEECKKSGSYYLKELHRILENTAKHAQPISLLGHKGYMVAGARVIAHDLAMMLCNKHNTFAAVFELESVDRVKISFRSLPDGPDVESIAKTFGGGGHKHAAACYVRWNQLSEILQAN